ncbi:MAG: flagellar motor switch protein FliN [Deltaproteobacteria bacterium]|nr:flagellar motor switch protein FliN [Deltaproteobacteria bacterium]MBW1718201.1 flagellar motor switch protein FliN [Deltaproteobacteria bacterium]MBW1938165.1 flagellar motor switch protein FliN [Deltaproteobacteria bacterium]
MGQNDLIEEVKETKPDEDIDWDDVQNELEESKQSTAGKEASSVNANLKETKPDEDIGWDDVQNELEESKQPTAEKEASGVNVDLKETKPDENIGWDDVQNELEESKQPTVAKEASGVNFEKIKKSETKGPSLDLDFILDIPITVTVELGRGKMMIGKLLQLGQSSVIELTKLAGEPMDVFVNNRLIAKGEVVVVNEKFGVRLTDVVSAAERINKLK